MTQEVNEQSQEQPQTIDDIATKFNVTETAQQFNAQPQQQPAPVQPRQVNIPDPALDVEGFKNWASQVDLSTQDVRQTLHSINERLSKADQERVRNQEEADLKAAVSVLKDGVDGVDDETVEVYLGVKARKDPKLMTIWNQRSQKPEAWKAALNVLKQDMGKKFSVKSDPQLAENQRAMKVSRDQMATTQRADPNEKWGSMKPAEFENEWNRLVHGG